MRVTLAIALISLSSLLCGRAMAQGEAEEAEADAEAGAQADSEAEAEADAEADTGADSEAEARRSETDEVGGGPSPAETGDGPSTDSGEETGAAGTGTVPADHADEPEGDEGPRPDGQREGSPPTPSTSDAEPEPSLLETSPFLLSLAFFTGIAQENDFDDALANLGYSPSEWFWGLDLSAETRIARVLWLGARGDFRMRQWGFRGGDSADAFGASLLALADVRIPLNRVLDVGGIFGAGFGMAIVTLHGVSQVAGLPRLHFGLQFGVTLFSGLRVHMGAAFDYAESLALNDFGDSVSFSIAAFRFGFEGRL